MSDFTVISDTNPLYAEIERLKRERDMLADNLGRVTFALAWHAEKNGVGMDAKFVADARAALAQVRK